MPSIMFVDGGQRRLKAVPTTRREFTYHYKDAHRCKIKMIEFVPGKKVVWHVLDNFFSFTRRQSRVKGTLIRFESRR